VHSPSQQCGRAWSQVCHHPTIIAAVSEGRRWKLEGDAELRSKFWGRSIELHPVGLLRLTFADGDEYTWSKARPAARLHSSGVAAHAHAFVRMRLRHRAAACACLYGSLHCGVCGTCLTVSLLIITDTAPCTTASVAASDVPWHRQGMNPTEGVCGRRARW
jgi:hypothetical protein